MCRYTSSPGRVSAEHRYDFDFRILRRGLRGYLWAFPCLIAGVPHANIGAYSLTPVGAPLDAALAGLSRRARRGRRARYRAAPLRAFRSIGIAPARVSRRHMRGWSATRPGSIR